MTTITRPATEQPRHVSRRDAVGQLTRPIHAAAQRLKSAIADVALGGQLGPDPEVEVGRWTGARV